MGKEWGETVDKVLKEFILLVTKSPMAIVTFVLSTFFGYGISFIIFDYRKSSVGKSHHLFHMVIGFGYTAIIFALVNSDLLSHNLTVEQILARMPLTLLVSSIVAFFIITAGAIWQQFFYLPKEGK